ncbi:hypothetical protein P3G55_01775 [Leptospira sp. 96542]|nr:hypothetical protein [Leptospira sp. 96542]
MKLKNLVLRSGLVLLGTSFQIFCTFGSVGNKNEEDLIILQNLLQLIRNTRSSLSTKLVLFGDQVDSNPERFTVTSGGTTTYSVQVESDSYVHWENGLYRFNPNQVVSGVFNVEGSNGASNIESPLGFSSNMNSSQNLTDPSFTHTPFTVPLDLPTTDPYAASYSFLNPGSEIIVKPSNIVNDFGFAHLSTSTKNASDAPLGVVSLVTLSWEEIYIHLTVDTVTPSAAKDIKILLRQGIQTIRPKCKIENKLGRTTPVEIGFRYRNLFLDRTDLGTNNDLLNKIYAGTSPINVSFVSLNPLYEGILKNIASEDSTFYLPGCFPGVEK